MQKLSERIFGVFQEETVVAERRHGNWDLGQVVQVLQHRTLGQQMGTRVYICKLLYICKV